MRLRFLEALKTETKAELYESGVGDLSDSKSYDGAFIRSFSQVELKGLLKALLDSGNYRSKIQDHKVTPEYKILFKDTGSVLVFGTKNFYVFLSKGRKEETVSVQKSFRCSSNSTQDS